MTIRTSHMILLMFALPLIAEGRYLKKSGGMMVITTGGGEEEEEDGLGVGAIIGIAILSLFLSSCCFRLIGTLLEGRESSNGIDKMPFILVPESPECPEKKCAVCKDHSQQVCKQCLSDFTLVNKLAYDPEHRRLKADKQRRLLYTKNFILKYYDETPLDPIYTGSCLKCDPSLIIAKLHHDKNTSNLPAMMKAFAGVCYHYRNHERTLHEEFVDVTDSATQVLKVVLVLTDPNINRESQQTKTVLPSKKSTPVTATADKENLVQEHTEISTAHDEEKAEQ